MMSIIFNQICLNEEMLPKYTHTYIHTYIYIEREGGEYEILQTVGI